MSQKGDSYDEKQKACEQCPKQCSPPARDEDDEPDQDAIDLADEIEYLVAWQRAGMPIDWSKYSFQHQELTVVWFEQERLFGLAHEIRMRMWIKSKFKDPKEA